VNGTGIDFTAVGIGTATLAGDLRVDNAGDYALDGGKWLAVPQLTKRSVTFGLQTPTVTTP